MEAPLPIRHFSLNGARAEMATACLQVPPPEGIFARNWGAAKGDLARGLHQQIEVNLWLFRPEAGGAWRLLVCLDYCLSRREDDLEGLRQAWAAVVGTEPEAVWIALSHTHASASISPVHADRLGGELIEPYREALRERVAVALQEALGQRFVGEMTWEAGHCTLAKNRDYWLPQENRYACGFNPGAGADTTLLVGRVCDASGKVRSVLVNYACHPTTLAWENERVSPDYVGALRETIRERYPTVPVCFLQGASGELAPRRQYTGDTRVADANGRTLGYAALSVLEGMLPPGTALEWGGVVESGAPLGVWNEVPFSQPQGMRSGVFSVMVPLKALESPQALEAEIARLEAEGERVRSERLRRRLLRVLNQGERTEVEAVVSWWELGGTLWIAQGTEFYSEFQEHLRDAFPEKTVVVVTLANTPSLTYFYPQALADADVYQTWVSTLGRDGLTLMKDGVVRCLREALG